MKACAALMPGLGAGRYLGNNNLAGLPIGLKALADVKGQAKHATPVEETDAASVRPPTAGRVAEV